MWSQNEKLKILVTQRYSWDTFWYEELLNKTKKNYKNLQKEVRNLTDSKQENKMPIQAEKNIKKLSLCKRYDFITSLWK